MIDGNSLSLTEERIKALKALMPDVFSENKVDWDRLRQALGEEVFVKEEHFELNWVGKSEAQREVRNSTTDTLKPDRQASVDFDLADNIFIEGENLKVLRVLQRAYFGKIKMIYIDPPYNTGSDFIYKDSYSESRGEYLQRTEQLNEDGYLKQQDLWPNRRENGRFHSNWLTMIYPRLFVARSLLQEDGVMIVSIDDNEAHNLKMVMDEIFGGENFIVQLIWKKRSTPPNDQIIGANHEYLLVYAKNSDQVKLNLKSRSDEQLDRYKNPDDHPKGRWTSGDLMANVKGGRYVSSLHFPITNPTTKEEHYPSNNGNWRFNRQKIASLLEANEIYFGEDGRGRPKLKRFLSEVKDGITYPSIWDFVAFNSEGSSEMAELLGNMNIFDNPKPTSLIKELIRLGSGPNDIILDFFAGSSTTAQAVLELNAEDGGKRSFLLVQFGQQTDSKSEAYKAGYKSITDISLERIRRVIGKMNRAKDELMDRVNLLKVQLEEKKIAYQDELARSGSATDSSKAAARLADNIDKLDAKLEEIYSRYKCFTQAPKNFRAYKIAPSNFNLWRSGETDKQTIGQLLFNFAQSDKANADSESMLVEFMLKAGFVLNTEIDRLDFDGIQVYSINKGQMLVLLDGYNAAINKLLWESQPQRVVCLDRLFEGQDEVLANLHLELRDRGIDLTVI